MATQAEVRRSTGVRALVGATAVAVAVLGGAIWQLRPSGAAPRPHATNSGTAVTSRPMGGMAERYQYQAQVTEARPLGGMAELLRDRPQGPIAGPRTPAVRAQSNLDNPIIGAWQTHAVSSTAGVQANLLAFLPGGVLIHAASNFPQSAGIGVWYDAGDGTVVYTFTYRRMDKSTGAYIGSTHVHARVTVGPDGLSYDSPLYTELTDVDDNVTTTGHGTSHATRLVATPPDSSGIFAALAGSMGASAGAVPHTDPAQLRSSAAKGFDYVCGTSRIPGQPC